MTFEEYGATFRFGGDESEGTGVNEGEPTVVVDLVLSVEAEIVSLVMKDVPFQAVETGGVDVDETRWGSESGRFSCGTFAIRYAVGEAFVGGASLLWWPGVGSTRGWFFSGC